MGDPHQTTWPDWNEVGQFISKATLYLLYIAIGAIAKLAFEAQAGALTRKQKIIKVILSVFAGYTAAGICEALHQKEWAKVIVPVSTLIGDALVTWFITNWKLMAEYLFRKKKV